MPDVRSWNLSQLIRATTKSAQPSKFAWTTIQAAWSLAEPFDNKADKSNLKHLRSVKEAVQVAIIAATEMQLDLATVVTAILAPPFLSGWITQELIQKQFSEKTLAILIELDTLKQCRIQIDTIRKYPAYLDKDDPHILAILLQICDIIHTYCSGTLLENLSMEPIHSSSQLLLELKCFYIPFAHRVRLYDIQTKLADFWLKHSETLSYYAITAKLGMTKVQRQKKLSMISEEVYAAVKSHGINFTMKKRIKSVYSIWHKIQRLRVDFGQIHDLSAVRIILLGMESKTLQEEKIACWRVLTIISNLYQPICNIMRDWISRPRESGYESLHLTFETYKYGRLEVQIRTERMDYIAEYGDAAHWKYKCSG